MTGGRRGGVGSNPWVVALVAIAVLAAAQFALPSYHHTNVARIMVFAIFAIGYNVAFGYAGLLSLGHALFFGAGLYAAGMSAQFLGFSVPAAFGAGIAGGLVLALATGLIVLRTSGVAFMIVTLMFSQAAYLTILYFNEFTRGDEGFVLVEGIRQLAWGGTVLPLSDPTLRYNLALLLFALAYLLSIGILRAPLGRVLVAVRENEARAQMLGYNTFGYKLLALGISGALAGAAGAAYALLFAYVGATFASIQYSIYALLWVLLGGAGTTLGPLIGTAAMFYLVEFSSEITSSYLIVVGILLVVLVLAFPKGVIGSIAAKWGAPRS